jgi:gliding motility-associated-like protein
MENKDQIKELFQQQLSNHQEAVRPEIWASVSSSIATPLGATASLSVLAKILISAGIITSVLIGGYFMLATEDAVKQPTAPNSKQDYTSKDVIITDSLATKADKPLVLPNKQQKNAVLDYKKHDVVNEPFVSDSVHFGNNDENYANKDHGEEIAANPIKQEGNSTAATHTEEEMKNQAARLETSEIEEKQTLVLTNVFTPNGDGANDYLFIQSEGLQDFSVVILNQANKIIYQSTDPKFNWDGKLTNGDDAPIGQYVYFITAKSDRGDLINKYSTLFIQR